mgnify:CR=1 FL=1
MNYIKHRTKKLFQVFEHGGAEAPSERTKDQKPGYSHEYRYPNLSEGVQRYEVSDPPVSLDGLHDPSDIGQSGFRNPLWTCSVERQSKYFIILNCFTWVL